MVYVGLVMLVRRQARNLSSSMWLDGIVAGLGAAGVCACFAFNTILRSTGGDPAASVATNLAYPIGDLLLLALVVGVTAILPGRRNAQWILLALACGINAAGDGANLLRGPSGGSRSAPCSTPWPGRQPILLISLSLWLRPGRSKALGVAAEAAGNAPARSGRRRRAGHPALRLVPPGQRQWPWAWPRRPCWSWACASGCPSRHLRAAD